MLQETMKTVEAAETQAEDMLKKARVEADAIVAKAKQDAEKIIADAGAKTRADMKTARESIKAEEDTMTEEALKSANDEIAGLRENARKKQQEAADLIIRELV